MNNMKNIGHIVSSNLCLGCGVCQDACPKSAITVKAVNGVFRPTINSSLCINDKGCHRCRKVCPGDGVNIAELSSKYFSSNAKIKDDKYIGKYISLCYGFSNDNQNRYESASGGLTSEFLIYLLENKYIQGAIVTRFNRENAFWVETFVATTKQEILSAKSSKYCPVTMAGVVEKVKQLEGKYAIVGLPCHLHGLRKMAEIDKRFSDKVFAYIGLYCSCGRSFKLTEYVFNSRGIDTKDVLSFTYRRGPGMGRMLAKVTINSKGKNGYQDCHSNSETHPHKEERIYEDGFQNYYLSLRSFFNLHRCMLCIDHFAELGDICFGDLHTGKFIEDKVGISSVVTRLELMDKILHKMADEKVITLGILEKETLLDSQKYVKTKKHFNPAYMKIDKLLGRKIPVYDIPLSGVSICHAMKGYLVKVSQMFVGKRKHLHWIIRFLSKDMKNWK